MHEEEVGRSGRQSEWKLFRITFHNEKSNAAWQRFPSCRMTSDYNVTLWRWICVQKIARFHQKDHLISRIFHSRAKKKMRFAVIKRRPQNDMDFIIEVWKTIFPIHPKYFRGDRRIFNDVKQCSRVKIVIQLKSWFLKSFVWWSDLWPQDLRCVLGIERNTTKIFAKILRAFFQKEKKNVRSGWKLLGAHWISVPKG